MIRSLAFRRKAPDGWKPGVGERVFVRCMPGTMSSLISTGTVTKHTTDDTVVGVRLEYGTQQSNRLWRVDDLRPIGAIRATP